MHQQSEANESFHSLQSTSGDEVLGDETRFRAQFMDSGPKRYTSELAKQKAIFVMSGDRDEFHSKFNGDEVCTSNVFARVIKLKHPQVLLVVLNDSSDLGKVKTILLETGLKFSIQTTKKLKEVDESERSAKRWQLHDQTNLVEKGPIRRAALLPRSGRLQQGNRVEENPR